MGDGQRGFSIADYVIFIGTIAISLGIGLYYAFSGGKQKTTGEYLMGDRQLKIVPVALSMLVSFISAVGILGTPAEMYAYGTQYSMYIIAAGLGCFYGAFLFVPVLYPLKLTSSFEYFELRYKSKAPRLLSTIIMLLNQVFMNGTGLFAPSVALQAVTGFPVWLSMIICGVTATIYTTLGGMKAVIYTDVFQSIIIFLGMIAVVAVGTYECGGVAEVWRLNGEWDRLEFFNINPDPRERTTFWSIVVMMSILWMCVTAAQTSVQRYCALPTERAAKISVLLNIPGFVIIGFLTCFSGIVCFAYYAKIGCDPLSQHKITNLNQILPYFVMDVMGYPGIPGLFVACLYSGALSTASSSLNSMAAVTWEDLLKWKYNYLAPNKQATIAKVIVAVYGAMSIGMGFTVELLGGTFIQIVFSVMGTTAGPIVGMLFLGATFPRAGPKGALLGSIIGFSLSCWMAIGAYSTGIHSPPRSFPIANCTSSNTSTPLMSPHLATVGNITMNRMDPSYNMTPPVLGNHELQGVENLYAVSYLWYPTVGLFCVMLIGILSSFIPGMSMKGRVSRKYLFPIVRGFSDHMQSPDAESESEDEEEEEKLPEKIINGNEHLIYKPKPKLYPELRDPDLYNSAEETKLRLLRNKDSESKV